MAKAKGSADPAGPAEQTIVLGGRPVPYRLRFSTRARYLRLQAGPRNGLEVIAPAGVDQADVSELLRRKEGWILDQLDRIARSGGQEVPVLESGATIPYLGRPHRLEIRIDPDRQPTVRRSTDTITVWSPRDDPSYLRAIVEAWYRHEARRVLAAQVADINASFGFTYQRITIKGQRGRWGSCSEKGNLNFNWRLMLAPMSVIRYVVTHELAHLGEMNHSPKFWALVESRCPNYKAEQEWLKENGAALLF